LKRPQRRRGLRPGHAVDRSAGKSAAVQFDLRLEHRFDRTQLVARDIGRGILGACDRSQDRSDEKPEKHGGHALMF